MDASTLGQRFTVLAVCIVYRGCAIPVAWAVVSATATAKGRWTPWWLELVTALHSSSPTEWCVIVLTDRGLYARWLFEAIAQAAVGIPFCGSISAAPTRFREKAATASCHQRFLPLARCGAAR